MRNSRKLTSILLGLLGFSAVAAANPNPVYAQLGDYFLEPTLVGDYQQLATDAATGTYQFGPLGLPSNYTNFQASQGFRISESFDAPTQTITAIFSNSAMGDSVDYDYTAPVTAAPGGILFNGSSGGHSYLELKPKDVVFARTGGYFEDDISVLGNLTVGTGIGQYEATYDPSISVSSIYNGTSTTLEFQDKVIGANFKPDIDLKVYGYTNPVPDPACYLGLGAGFLGFGLRRRRRSSTA